MNRTRKRVVVHVAWILGVAFLVGMAMSLLFAGSHGREHPLLWKAMVGVIGPFILIFNDGFLAALVVGLMLALLVAPIILGIVKCRLLPALLGAIPLALLWIGSMFLVCVVSNLS